MVMHPYFSSCSGLNDVLDPLRIKYDPKHGLVDLAEAVNIDIDASGFLSRRNGYYEIDPRSCHSVFTKDGMNQCFVVVERTNDAAVYSLISATGGDKPTFTLSGVRDSLTKGAEMSWEHTGGKTYYTNGYEMGYIDDQNRSFPWPVTPHVGVETTRSFAIVPLGHLLCCTMGRMWIAVEDGEFHVIYFSEPYAYGKYDHSQRGLVFGSKIQMMKAVANGVWISDSQKTGFIPNAVKIDDLQWIPKTPFPAHRGSANINLVDLSSTPLQIPGLSAIWSSDAGLNIGTEDGRLIVCTSNKLNYSKGFNGATVVNDLVTINSVW